MKSVSLNCFVEVQIKTEVRTSPPKREATFTYEEGSDRRLPPALRCTVLTYKKNTSLGGRISSSLPPLAHRTRPPNRRTAKGRRNTRKAYQDAPMPHVVDAGKAFENSFCAGVPERSLPTESTLTGGGVETDHACTPFLSKCHKFSQMSAKL